MIVRGSNENLAEQEDQAPLTVLIKDSQGKLDSKSTNPVIQQLKSRSLGSCSGADYGVCDLLRERRMFVSIYLRLYVYFSEICLHACDRARFVDVSFVAL